MAVDFTFPVPGVEAMVTVSLVDGPGGVAGSAASFGFSVPQSRLELPAVTLNMFDDATGAKWAAIVVDVNRVDVETVSHEMRHALFWIFSNGEGVFSVSPGLEDDPLEEEWNDVVDLLVRGFVTVAVPMLGRLDYCRGLLSDG